MEYKFHLHTQELLRCDALFSVSEKRNSKESLLNELKLQHD